MLYTIELRFDKSSDYKIKEFINNIEEEHDLIKKLKTAYHITLSLFEIITDKESLLECIRHDLSFDQNIWIDSVGSFSENPIVWLKPNVSQELLSFHRKVQDDISPYISNPNPLYLPENWVPHVSVALVSDGAEQNKLINELGNMVLPRIRVDRISLIKYDPCATVLFER